MDIYDKIDRISESADDSKKDEDPVEKEKSKLRKQIDQLKSIILQMEWNLDLLKFGKTKVTHADACQDPVANKIPNIDIKLRSHLYKYSGFYCTKFSKKEYVFNFSPSYKHEKENTFAIQVFNKQGVGNLGNWIMPMSIDLNDILSKYPIQQMKHVPQFFKICKHYMDCYFMRREQYNDLMKIVSETKNCDLQSNLGYTQINLDVMGVHNAEDDSYINLVIYLLYDINEARPHRIEVDTKIENKLDINMLKRLKTALKCYKVFDLRIAFEKMLSVKPFTWSKELDEDSPVEMNTMSSSDEEGFLEEFSLQEKKSPILWKKKRRKRIQRKETSQKDISKRLKMSEHDKESASLENDKKNFENVNPTNLVDINTIQSTPHANVSKHKALKQTKLRFKLDQESKKPYTSTPMRSNMGNFNLIASTSIDISDITVSQASSDSVKSKNYIDSIKERELEPKSQEQSNTPMKTIKSKLQKNVNTSIKSKSQIVKKKVARKRRKKT